MLEGFRRQSRSVVAQANADDFLAGNQNQVFSFIWKLINTFDSSSAGQTMSQWIESKETDYANSGMMEFNVSVVKNEVTV